MLPMGQEDLLAHCPVLPLTVSLPSPSTHTIWPPWEPSVVNIVLSISKVMRTCHGITRSPGGQEAGDQLSDPKGCCTS